MTIQIQILMFNQCENLICQSEILASKEVMITKAYKLTLHHPHHTICSNQPSGMVQVSLQTSVAFSTNLFVLSELSIVCSLSQIQFYNPTEHNDKLQTGTIQPFQKLEMEKKLKQLVKTYRITFKQFSYFTQLLQNLQIRTLF